MALPALLTTCSSNLSPTSPLGFLSPRNRNVLPENRCLSESPTLRLKPAGSPHITLGKSLGHLWAHGSQPLAPPPLPLALPPRHGRALLCPQHAQRVATSGCPRAARSLSRFQHARLRFLLKRLSFGRALPHYVVKHSVCHHQSACWLRVSSAHSRYAFVCLLSISPLTVLTPLAKVLGLGYLPAPSPQQHLVHRSYSLIPVERTYE